MMNDEWNYHSVLSTPYSESAEAAWLKEIQQ